MYFHHATLMMTTFAVQIAVDAYGNCVYAGPSVCRVAAAVVYCIERDYVANTGHVPSRAY